MSYCLDKNGVTQAMNTDVSKLYQPSWLFKNVYITES